MSLLPFNKHNCIAMLNTLYPPVVRSNPSPKLTLAILEKQRDGFFRYIKAVETRGCGVLQTLQKQGAAEGEANGWPDVHRNLEKYLRLTNSMIQECQDITNVSSFQPAPPKGPLPRIPENSTPNKKDKLQDQRKHARKTDSGVSFNSNRPLSRSSSDHASQRRPSAASAIEPTTPAKTPMTPRKMGTTLERIARELGRLRKGKPEVEEVFKTPGKTEKQKTPRSLKKMKSLGALSELKHSNASSSMFGKKNAQFDKDIVRQQRMAYEQQLGSDRRLGYDYER